jgi:hypothetical protein
MSKRFLILSAVIISIILSAYSIKSFYTKKDTTPIVFEKGSTFEKEWFRVDSLESVGLPKSALELCDEIYNKAKKESNIPQLVKAVMYQIKIVNYVEEDGLVKAIERIEKETQTTQTPIKQILHSVNADLYFKYYQKNKWKIFQILPLENNTSTDIKTWDAKKLSLKIISEYRASLSEIDSLQRISITTIEPLILSDGTTYQRTWPTIYDFVAYRAINAFAHNLLGLTKAADEFNLDDSKYFSNTQDFIELDLNTKDSLSLKYQAIKTVQDLVRFHTELENPDALIDVELFRLKLIYDNSKNTEKDKLYLERLQSLLEQYRKVPHSAYIRYQIAELAQKKASLLLLNIEEAEEFAKFNNLALEQINTIKTAKSDSLLIIKSDYLLSLINRSSISLITEEVVLPNEKFPINITSCNVHHIKIRVDKIDRKDIEKISDKNLYGYELYEELIKSSKEISKRKLILEKMNDYQQHSADLIMQELPKGTYILTLEACSEKGDSLSMHYSTINVTELSYLQRSNNGEFEVLVLNRKTGEAMPNVNVQIWNSSYDYS